VHVALVLVEDLERLVTHDCTGDLDGIAMLDALSRLHLHRKELLEVLGVEEIFVDALFLFHLLVLLLGFFLFGRFLFNIGFFRQIDEGQVA